MVSVLVKYQRLSSTSVTVQQYVKKLLANAIEACNKVGKYIGICGQGPSDHPDLAKWLMDEGIDTVSLNPDSVLDTWFFLADEKID